MQKQEHALSVGYARVDITPDYTVNLRGHGNNENRFSEGVVEKLYATCLAFTSGEDTILVYTIDALNVIAGYDMDAVRAGITSATGVPGEHIFFGATHCHNSPDPQLSERYRSDMVNWLAEAAQKALEDRAPAKMLAAEGQVEGMNYTRHYRNSDGSYFGSNFGKMIDPVGHVDVPDSQLILVKFQREAPKKDVLMINWQAHQDSAKEMGMTMLSSCWAAPLRDTVSNATGMQIAYFSGANGNVNKDSRIPDEDEGLTWREYGEKMGRIVLSRLDQLQPVEGTDIKSARVIYDASVNHSWDHMLPQANEVFALWKGTDGKPGDKKAANQLAREAYNFSSVYQAGAIRNRVNMGSTIPMELNAFRIGSVGFTTGTYEMWAASSLQLKKKSPFNLTFVVTGNHTYIPSQEAYEYRSYEADTSPYAPGTAEALVEQYIQMLNVIK